VIGFRRRRGMYSVLGMSVRYEPIAALRDRFNEPGVVLIIAERQSNLLDAVIEPLVKVDD
jgi:hypothetical protein